MRIWTLFYSAALALFLSFPATAQASPDTPNATEEIKQKDKRPGARQARTHSRRSSRGSKRAVRRGNRGKANKSVRSNRSRRSTRSVKARRTNTRRQKASHNTWRHAGKKYGHKGKKHYSGKKYGHKGKKHYHPYKKKRRHYGKRYHPRHRYWWPASWRYHPRVARYYPVPRYRRIWRPYYRYVTPVNATFSFWLGLPVVVVEERVVVLDPPQEEVVYVYDERPDYTHEDSEVVNMGTVEPEPEFQHDASDVGYFRTMEAEILELINGERAVHGLESLRDDARLRACSRQHSREMHTLNYFDHESPTARYKTLPKRLVAADVSQYGWAGENIAMSSRPSASHFVEMWMQSPGHRANILRPEYKYSGIGVFGDGNRVYATQVFSSNR